MSTVETKTATDPVDAAAVPSVASVEKSKPFVFLTIDRADKHEGQVTDAYVVPQDEVTVSMVQLFAKSFKWKIVKTDEVEEWKATLNQLAQYKIKGPAKAFNPPRLISSYLRVQSQLSAHYY